METSNEPKLRDILGPVCSKSVKVIKGKVTEELSQVKGDQEDMSMKYSWSPGSHIGRWDNGDIWIRFIISSDTVIEFPDFIWKSGYPRC